MSILGTDKILKSLYDNSEEVIKGIQDKVLNNEILSKQEQLLYDTSNFIRENELVIESEEKLKQSIETFSEVIDEWGSEKVEEGRADEKIEIAKRLKELDFPIEDIRAATHLKRSEIEKL